MFIQQIGAFNAVVNRILRLFQFQTCAGPSQHCNDIVYIAVILSFRESTKSVIENSEEIENRMTSGIFVYGIDLLLDQKEIIMRDRLPQIDDCAKFKSRNLLLK